MSGPLLAGLLFPRHRPRAETRRSGALLPDALRVRWLGTAGFVISTPSTTLVIDPFLSRHNFQQMLLSRLGPNKSEIDRWIAERVDIVACGHSHYDHVIDAPYLARSKGAKLLGSESTCHWGRFGGVPEGQLHAVPACGGEVRVGDMRVRLVPSKHGKAVLGRIPTPGFVTHTPSHDGRLLDYKLGGAFGVYVQTPFGNVYHNGSADLIDAEIAGLHADVLLVGLAGRRGTERYLNRLVDALSPALIVPTHHDAFFSPVDDGVYLLPRIDVDGFLRDCAIYAPRATALTPLYHETICVPAGDARGSFLARK